MLAQLFKAWQFTEFKKFLPPRLNFPVDLKYVIDFC